MQPSRLPLTGERTVPGIAEENYWFRRHEAAYEFAAPLVADITVLEVGCGEGYGTALLARHARHVIGVDYDALTVAHAAATYPSTMFVRGNLAGLPAAAAAVDAVLTLQVIEHVWDHGEFVHECQRVLRPDGLLFVTTPNRLTFTPGSDTPVNPFHTVEFTAAELGALLVRHGFELSAVHGLHAGPRLRALDEAYGSFIDAQLSTPPAQWPDQLVREVAAVTTEDFPVLAADQADIDASLDLIVLARAR